MAQDELPLSCPYCGGEFADGQRFCPGCGAPRVGAGAIPEAAAAAESDLGELLQEVRALRSLQAQTGIRLRRLEERLEGLSAPAGDGGEEFTFQSGPPQAGEREPAGGFPPAGRGRPFKYGPGDRPGDRPGDHSHGSTPREEAYEAARGSTPPLRRVRRRFEERRERGSLERAVGQKWLLAVGLVVMVFGIGYFLKYTFSKGWIGPTGQLALAYVWSAGLLAAGEGARRRGYELFGLWVLAGGVASLYFATFAGHRLFDLLPPAPAFALLAATTAGAIMLAVRHNALGLAVLGMLGGYLTPVLLSDLDDSAWFLFGYLTVLNAGVLATAFFKRWNGLSWLGLVGSFLLFGAWYADEYGMWLFGPALGFVNLTFLGYAAVPLSGAPVRKAGLEAQRSVAWLAAVASYLGMIYSYDIIEGRYGEAWTALPCLGYAMVFGALALLQRSSQEEAPGWTRAFDRAAVLSTHAALYFALAVPLAFEGSLITALWALQGAGLLYLGVRLEGRGLVFVGQAAMLAALSRLLLWDYEETFGLVMYSGLKSLQGAVYTFYGGFFARLPERLATETAVLGALGFSSWALARLRMASETYTGKGRGGGIIRLAFIGGLLVVLSVECLAFFGEIAPEAREASLSALWALYATGLMAWGFRKGSKGSRLAALILFAVTLFKVVLVDMAAFSTPYRILSFLVLGSLLVAASFLYHKYKDKLEQGDETPERV